MSAPARSAPREHAKLRVTLAAASLCREAELPGFEEISDYASESYNLAVLVLKAAALADHDLVGRVAVEVVDLAVPWDGARLPGAAVETVVGTRPDVLGLSCYCWSLDALADLAADVVGACPGAFVVAGGPAAGPVASEVLAAHPAIDAVATGEGERTFVALLRALLDGGPLCEVPGLCSRGPDGEPVASEASLAPVDLATLPSPYRAGAVAAPPRSLLLETSRGCRYHCRFCSWVSSTRRLRYASLDSIEADLRWAVERGIGSVKLVDTAVNFETDRLAALVAAVARADPGRALRFSYFLKAELLDAAQLDLLRGLPSAELIVGIESVDDEVRRAAGKPRLDLRAFELLLERLADVGPVTLSFVMGLPGDNAEVLARSLDWAIDLDARRPGRLHEICLFWLAVLPGSKLRAERVARGYRLAARGTPYLLESLEHSADDLLQMARVAAERHYAHPALRIETFHRAYLTQDAPVASGPPIARRAADARPLALLVGAAGAPSSLDLASAKAFAEADAGLRREWRVELASLGARGAGLDAAGARLDASDGRLVVVALEGLGDPEPVVEALGRAAPRAAVIVTHAGDTLVEAEEALRSIERADGVVSGELERPVAELLRGGLDRAAGLVRRDGSGVAAGPPLEPVADLDLIPSPFQWGLVCVRDAEPALMRLGRSGRVHGPRRVHGDLRWAIEQRLRHVLWLDPALPGALEALDAFVSAAARADPDGRLRHSYALPDVERGPALEILARLPARSIAVPVPRRDDADVRALASRSGAELVVEPRRLDPERVRALLRPWLDRPALEGWAIEGVELRGADAGTVLVTFAHERGARAAARLTRRPLLGVSVAVLPGRPRPPDADRLRLAAVLGRWIARGERFLLGRELVSDRSA